MIVSIEKINKDREKKLKKNKNKKCFGNRKNIITATQNNYKQQEKRTMITT